MVLWETVLSPALQVLFDRLASGDILQFLKRCNLSDLLLEKLKIAYFTNAAVIDDAEKKQYNNPAIETWLEMLKNSVYEAEDTLDELATEALRSKLESASAHSNQVTSWNFLSTSFSPFGETINTRMESLIEKLEYIAKQKDFLGLRSVGDNENITLARLTTPQFNESHVYGRDFEKEEIIKLLFSDNQTRSSNLPFVIPILGMGGIGKTTLARIVYNDVRVNEYFNVKAWAYVSDDFNVTRTIKSLLESATGKPCDTMNLELLQSRLKDVLNKKKFLVVLDDVWSEKLDNWDDLSIPFNVGGPGSKIIVTTRNEEVLSNMNAFPSYRLKEISDDACWSLFAHHLFVELHSSLIPIGRNLMTRCKGMPLAVKTLGSVLASKMDPEYWNMILESKLWELPPKKNAILPSLRLSYHHLPSNLKRCFAYCSIFPKGYEFDKKRLVLLWMAEGFVQPVGNISIEEVGERYFSELLSRSFFQESIQDGTRYVMHDLLNDLAQSVSRETCVCLEENWKMGKHRNFEKVRHFSCLRSKYDVYRKFEPLEDAKWLRTFLPVASQMVSQISYLSKRVSLVLLPKFKCLRVLSLNGYCISELPENIGNLKHLRYLDLSYTEIGILPQSICKLFNLQTLLLCNCDYLTELPAEIGKLVNLRYLDIVGSTLLIEGMPNGLCNLVNLRELPWFTVGNSGSKIMDLRNYGWKTGELSNYSKIGELRNYSKIGELRNLVNLQSSLTISRLENVASSWDARRANLQEKIMLNQLVLEWSANIPSDLLDGNVVTEVLEMLQPNPKTEKVILKNYPGKNFPTWIGCPTFSLLVTLALRDCQACESLPPLGQLPSLKNLHIEGMHGVKNVNTEFYGSCNSSSLLNSFPSLEILCLKEMLEWADWSFYAGEVDMEPFHNLLELHLERCPKLNGSLPNRLPSLKKLVIRECQQLSSSLPKVPKLVQMELKECHVMLFSGSSLEINLLTSLEIENMKNLTQLSAELVRYLTRLEKLVINDCIDLVNLASEEDNGLLHLTSLQHLTIRNCSSIVSLSLGLQQLPQNLEYLELDSCHSLERLPNAFQNLSSLRELVITDCPRLDFFSRSDIFPSNLKGLALRGCGLESLPEFTINNVSSLEFLYISGCLVLASFPRGDDVIIPTSFKQLTIEHCPNLESLPHGMMHGGNMFLESLEIFDCSSVTSLPRGNLPKTLKTLTIWNCFNLESLADVITERMSLESIRIGNCTNLKYLPSDLHTLVHLDYLEVDGCPNLESFPEEGLPSRRLKKLHILNCENLKFIANSMQNVTSLHELRLSNCPMIDSFPEDGMPINLVLLDIINCENVKPCSKWGLHRLNSLRKLRIHGCCLKDDGNTFPEFLLPPTLETLHLVNQPSLKSLSPWLKNLTSLEELKIKECNEIVSLPNEGLPYMVSFLEIRGCPLLQQSLKDLSPIDDVPCIVM